MQEVALASREQWQKERAIGGERRFQKIKRTTQPQERIFLASGIIFVGAFSFKTDFAFFCKSDSWSRLLSRLFRVAYLPLDNLSHKSRPLDLILSICDNRGIPFNI